MRVVLVEGVLVPDPRARIAGRGAWVHPDPACLDLAERRRALPRALRVPGPLDDTAVRAELDRRSTGSDPHDQHHPHDQHAPHDPSAGPPAGGRTV